MGILLVTVALVPLAAGTTAPGAIEEVPTPKDDEDREKDAATPWRTAPDEARAKHGPTLPVDEPFSLDDLPELKPGLPEPVPIEPSPRSSHTEDDAPMVAPVCNLIQDDADTGTDTTWTHPTPLPTGQTIGCLDRYDEIDGYTIDAEAGDSVRLDLSVPDNEITCADYDLVLLDPDGFLHTYSVGIGCVDEHLGAFFHTPGTYTLLALRYDGEGTYTLDRTDGGVDAPPCAPQDDGGSGADTTFSSPLGLPDGTTTGCLDEADDLDWYSVSLSSGETLNVTSTATDCPADRTDYDLFLLSEALTFVDASFRWGCRSDSIEHVAQSDRALYLIVVRFEGDGGYDLDRQAQDADVAACVDTDGNVAQDDAGSGTDATFEARVDLTTDASGCLNGFDWLDWYTIEAAPGTALETGLTVPGCAEDPSDYDLFLLNEDGGLLDASLRFDCSDEHVSTFVHRGADDQRTFHLVVYRFEGTGGYDLTLDRTPAEAACHPQSDGSSQRDSRFGNPVPLSDGVAVGCMGAGDILDAYTYEAARGDLVEIATQTEPFCASLILFVLDEDVSLVAADATQMCIPPTVEVLSHRDQTFTVVVFSLETVDYQLATQHQDVSAGYL